MGRPPSHETRGTFVEIVPLQRLRIRFLIDFIDGVEPYPYHVLAEFLPAGTNVRMVTTVDPHHHPEWTRMATLGWESQLRKLPAILAARRRDA